MLHVQCGLNHTAFLPACACAVGGRRVGERSPAALPTPPSFDRRGSATLVVRQAAGVESISLARRPGRWPNLTLAAVAARPGSGKAAVLVHITGWPRAPVSSGGSFS